MTGYDELPTCCQDRGLNFGDGRRACYRHQTPEEKALVVDLDRRVKPIVGDLGWPYGPNIDVPARQRLVSWAEYEQLTLGKTSCRELHWLLKGRCGVQRCEGIGGSWYDHVTRWKRDGKPALMLAQPYGLGNEDVQKVGELASHPELTVWVHARGWYGSATNAVEVWRSDVYEDWIRRPRED